MIDEWLAAGRPTTSFDGRDLRVVELDRHYWHGLLNARTMVSRLEVRGGHMGCPLGLLELDEHSLAGRQPVAALSVERRQSAVFGGDHLPCFVVFRGLEFDVR